MSKAKSKLTPAVIYIRMSSGKQEARPDQQRDGRHASDAHLFEFCDLIMKDHYPLD